MPAPATGCKGVVGLAHWGLPRDFVNYDVPSSLCTLVVLWPPAGADFVWFVHCYVIFTCRCGGSRWVRIP